MIFDYLSMSLPYDIRLAFSRFNAIGIKSRQISLFSEIAQILGNLKNINDEKPQEDVTFFCRKAEAN